MSKDDLNKLDVEPPTVDWLIEQLAASSPLAQFNAKRLKELIAQLLLETRIDALQDLEHAREEVKGPDRFISKYITNSIREVNNGTQ